MPLSGDHFCQGGKFRGRERRVGPVGIYWLNVAVACCSEVRVRMFPSTEPLALLWKSDAIGKKGSVCREQPGLVPSLGIPLGEEGRL